MELRGKRVAILVEDDYEDLELWYPTLRLLEAGAQVTVVGTGAAGYTSRHGIVVQADAHAGQVQAEDFDALVIPSSPASGVREPSPALTRFVGAAIRLGKVVAAAAAAGHSLVAAQAQSDARALRFFGMQEEVVQGDGPYKDSAVIRQGNLILARLPVDLPAFCRMIIAALAAAPGPPSGVPGPAAGVASPPVAGF
jgi:protease I